MLRQDEEKQRPALSLLTFAHLKQMSTLKPVLHTYFLLSNKEPKILSPTMGRCNRAVLHASIKARVPHGSV